MKAKVLFIVIIILKLNNIAIGITFTTVKEYLYFCELIFFPIRTNKCNTPFLSPQATKQLNRE